MLSICALHEIVDINGKIYLLDVSETPDAGWEGAYSIFDEETFSRNWTDTSDEAYDEYTFDDIQEYGEDFNAFDDWTVVSSHHKTAEAAEKKLRKKIMRIARE